MGISGDLSNAIGFGSLLSSADDSSPGKLLLPSPGYLNSTGISTLSDTNNVATQSTWNSAGFHENFTMLPNIGNITETFIANKTEDVFHNSFWAVNQTTTHDMFGMTIEMINAVLRMRKIEQQLWRIGAPMVIFLGTLGNVLSGVVMSRKCMRRSVTGFYLLVLAFADTLVLYTGLLRLWLKETYQHDLRSAGVGVCKFHSFLVYWSSDFAAWVIVIVTLERFVSVVFPHRAKNLVTRRGAIVSLVAIGVALVFINSHLLHSSDLLTVILAGGRKVTYCGLTPGHFADNVWPWMDFATFSLVPFVVLIFCNLSILIVLLAAHYRRQHLNLVSGSHPRMTTMTAILLAVSFTFFLLTAPITIYLILQRTWINSADPVVDAQASLGWAIVNILSYSNNAINFLLYCVTGSKFRSQLATVFICSCTFNRVAPGVPVLVHANTNNTNTTEDL